ncbi:MAG: DUF4935 domain-containing protein [Sphingobacteriaceae bacterium]|nr:DUF4935 domain-containing protein [Sphingobacteriaceae bacterium]
MVSIFLDSNALFSDPLFKSSFGALLLEYAREGKVKLFISSIVIDEISNNYEKIIGKHFQAIRTELEKVNKLLQVATSIELPNPKTLREEISSFYTSLITDEVLTEVLYSNEILPELVKMSINRIKPFTERKQEFRDAIIWLSYKDTIKKLEIGNFFFISNNKDDFWDSDKKDLHPELKNDLPNIKLYSNFQELCTLEKVILKISTEKKFSTWFNNLQLDNKQIEKYLKGEICETVHQRIKRSIDKMSPSTYFTIDNGIYFEFSFEWDSLKVLNYTAYQLTDFASIACEVESKAKAVVYTHGLKHRGYFYIKSNISITLTQHTVVLDDVYSTDVSDLTKD